MKQVAENSFRISRYYARRGGYLGPYAEYERETMGSLRPGDVLLDIGCGRTFPKAGRWLETGATVLGLDPVIDHAMLLPAVKGIRGGAEEVPCPDESVDVVSSCAVLEHLESPNKVFGEIFRLLKKGGKAVLLTPSKYDYVSFVARVVPNRFHGGLVKATEGRSEDDTFATYYRANSRKDLSALAVGAGLVLERLSYLDQSPYSLSFSPALYKVGCCYHWLARNIPALGFLNGWILCIVSKPP